MITNRESLAWAAGFYDGEGCTSFTLLIKHGKPYRKIGVALGQKPDADGTFETLTKFQRIVGVGKIYKACGPGQVAFGTGKFEHVQHVLCLLWPWLSTRKKGQAMKCFKAYHAHPSNREKP